ncbi:TraB/GumN family protein [Thalassotalea sp. HSM 43]|uniref:TraB/GumN family protein n=1 Tax=Thalassotalea sp. HSM 43 TaxID=2552945 RepID=UPI0010819C88|nr:TraB/GumN family protein [Thalassotalea sp. HSM 43]QBY04752.1 TraB/GumN family protein [Thalassotalea sp. HSM 43]
MNRLWKFTAAATLCLFTTIASAKSPVWQVSKDGQTVYLGGTVHVLAQSDYPLPEAFEHAYSKSQILVLEMDMSATQTPAFQQQMMKKMTYQDGRTYEDVLKPETVKRLNTYMTERQLPIAQLKPLKPSMLSITLTMIELQRLGIGGTGVDMFYTMRGNNDDKSFKFLELPEEQIEFLANMGQGYEDEYINYTLDDMGRLADMMAEMKAAWRDGDSQALFDLAAKDWKDKFPKSYNSLIVTRNNNWIDDIESYFKTDEVEFVLVGALHLVGSDGVLKTLKDKGYTVKQL